MQINSTNQNINEPQPSPNTSSNSDQKLIEKKSSSIFSNNNPTDIFSNSIDVINQTANNYCLQKRNRINSLEIENINKLEIDDEFLNKKYENLHKNFIPKKKLINNPKQIMYKKMSIDLDSDSNQNQNFINTNFSGCNCKNSGCLKRYCECFSRMKYCDENCQCKNCFNVVQHEQERSTAIRNYIIKSPISFKKINIDLKNITCNCKKSNCLKNYCECFQLGMKCTYNCGCVDCKNRNLFEKKLFYVENKANTIENNKNVNSNIGNLTTNNITNNDTDPNSKSIKNNIENDEIIIDEKINDENTNNYDITESTYILIKNFEALDIDKKAAFTDIIKPILNVLSDEKQIEKEKLINLFSEKICTTLNCLKNNSDVDNINNLINSVLVEK